jgi:hypothetical protein
MTPPPPPAADAEDEWVRCARPHCPNGERFARAEERGWLTAHMGTWLCPGCQPAATDTPPPLSGEHHAAIRARADVPTLLDELDRLRAELEHERKRVAYWQECRDNYAAENRRLIGEKKQLRADLAEARMWARHGYEIGQRHCGWTDHGVAPGWLTEGWPLHFPNCGKHTKEIE